MHAKRYKLFEPTLMNHVIYVEDRHTSKFPTRTWTLPTNTNDFQQGLKTLLCLEHGMFFFFFDLLTSIYNQAMSTKRTTRRPPSETTKEGSRLICILSLGEFFFFCSFCSNNNFFYKLGYMCINYDGNNEHTPSPIPTQRGLRRICILEP